MISKAEPCLVVLIQNQVTLCIGTVIVRQIPVAPTMQTREIRWLRVFENKTTLTLYMYCEFSHYEFEILAWIITEWQIRHKNNNKLKKLNQSIK